MSAEDGAGKSRLPTPEEMIRTTRAVEKAARNMQRVLYGGDEPLEPAPAVSPDVNREMADYQRARDGGMHPMHFQPDVVRALSKAAVVHRAIDSTHNGRGEFSH